MKNADVFVLELFESQVHGIPTYVPLRWSRTDYMSEADMLEEVAEKFGPGRVQITNDTAECDETVLVYYGDGKHYFVAREVKKGLWVLAMTLS